MWCNPSDITLRSTSASVGCAPIAAFVIRRVLHAVASGTGGDGDDPSGLAFRIADGSPPDCRLLAQWPADAAEPTDYRLSTLPAETHLRELARIAKIRCQPAPTPNRTPGPNKAPLEGPPPGRAQRLPPASHGHHGHRGGRGGRGEGVAGERFSSAILPSWCRKSPKISEVLPLLYLHGLSSGDFVPALEQSLGSAAGLSPASATRLPQQWQAEVTFENYIDMLE